MIQPGSIAITGNYPPLLPLISAKAPPLADILKTSTSIRLISSSTFPNFNNPTRLTISGLKIRITPISPPITKPWFTAQKILKKSTQTRPVAKTALPAPPLRLFLNPSHTSKNYLMVFKIPHQTFLPHRIQLRKHII